MTNQNGRRIAGGIWIFLAISGAPLSAAVTPDPQNQPRSSRIGIYHWGGLKAVGIAAGIRDVVSLQATVARVAMSPRMDLDYNRGKDCIAGFSLAGTLVDPDVREALTNPGIKTFILTAYDGAGFSDCRTHAYLSPQFYSQASTARMIAEYSDLVYGLHALTQGSGKTFILSQWEGDNAIYCGSAYNYIRSAQFRQDCLNNYPSAYAGNQTPTDSIEGMVLWLQARHLGLTQGIARAREAGLTGVQVYEAPECSAVHLLHDAGLPSVLWDVIPRVSFDYVSYSSYESLSGGAAALSADLDLIRLLTGTDRIIVGEFGYSRSEAGSNLIASTRFAINTALAWGAAYVIQWNLYDQDRASDFGLYDVDGKITDLGAFYSASFDAEPLPGVDLPATQ